MTGTVIRCSDISELPMVAEQLVKTYPDIKVFLLSGKMGAGKTTLIKEVCKILKVVDIVNSPTFSLVNEYKTLNGESVFHFDLYRIKSPVELLDIGYEEYIFSGAVCLIEWPELANDLMPSSHVLINIDADERTDERIFQFSRHEDL